MKFDKDYFTANKIVALYMTAKSDEEAQKIMKSAPVELLLQINNTINKQTLALASKIANLTTRAQRNDELSKVPQHLREHIKHTAISIFDQSKMEPQTEGINYVRIE